MATLPGASLVKREALVRPRSRVRLFSVLLGAALLVSACGPKEEIVYVDRNSHSESDASAYTPIGRSADPRVHADGSYRPAPSPQIGPAHVSNSPEPYAPLATSHSPQVHAGGEPHLVATVTLAHERGSRTAASHAASTPTPASAARGSSNHESTVSTAASTAPRPAGALAAASPTVPARLSLGSGLGATPGASSTTGALASLAEEDIDLVTAAGRVERVDGAELTVQTSTGPQRVTLGPGVRVERDALGSADDLKPGQFVGVLQTPNGPAASVRLYATGPSMPKAGTVPMLGARLGQVTTYGSVVALQFGGLLLKTDTETTSVALPNTVEILRPVPVGAGDLVAGQQVIVTGVQTSSDALAATAVRITAESRAIR
jgi:hypothetical protein